MMSLAVSIEFRYEACRLAKIRTGNINYGCTQEKNFEIASQYAPVSPRAGWGWVC